jgi:hypothetical protein
MKRDLVDSLLKRVLEYAARGDGSFTEDMAREVEKEIRSEYGGTEQFVRKTGQDVLDKYRAAKTDVINGMSVSDASTKHGIPRRTIYSLFER